MASASRLCGVLPSPATRPRATFFSPISRILGRFGLLRCPQAARVRFGTAAPRLKVPIRSWRMIPAGGGFGGALATDYLSLSKKTDGRNTSLFFSKAGRGPDRKRLVLGKG